MSDTWKEATQMQFYPDYCLAVIEDTADWNQAILKRYGVTRTWQVYLYNAMEHTFVCSTSPAYWSVPVYHGYSMDGKPGDPLFDEFSEIAMEEYDLSEGKYWDARSIEAMPNDRRIHLGRIMDEGFDCELEEAVEREVDKCTVVLVDSALSIVLQMFNDGDAVWIDDDGNVQHTFHERERRSATNGILQPLW